MQALSTAATGMAAQSKNVDVISNNLANMETTAFKGRRADFQDLLYRNEERPGQLAAANGDLIPAGVQIGVGVDIAGTSPSMKQGSLQKTGNDFDVAIEGDGYFGVEMPNGERMYTRDGSLEVDPDGRIVTQDGHPIVTDAVVDPEIKDVKISADGVVTGFRDGQAEGEVLGQIDMFDFQNPAGLAAQGDNLLSQTDASGEAIQALPGDPGVGTLRQGFIEGSNVEAVKEITKLIKAQRAYEMNSKVVEAGDQMMATTSQIR